MTVWVVGEDRGTGDGGTRRRLASLAGTTEAELMREVLWINLWEHPGTDPDRYVRLVEGAAEQLDGVLLLGRRVQRAFGLDKPEPLSTIARNGGVGPTILALPHPSGRNRWYNDPDNLERARAAVRVMWGSHR